MKKCIFYFIIPLHLINAVPASATARLDAPETIVAQASAASSADRAAAKIFVETAQRRMRTDIKRLGFIDYGPISKLWCDATVRAPTPTILAECAAASFGAVAKMSNPQPSKEGARRAQARQSLGLIRAALEIADKTADPDPEIRERLSADADCLDRILRGDGDLSICAPPYGVR